MSIIKGFPALVRPSLQVIRSLSEKAVPARIATSLWGVERIVVLDQVFQHGNPLSAEQPSLKNRFASLAFRFGGLRNSLLDGDSGRYVLRLFLVLYLLIHWMVHEGRYESTCGMTMLPPIVVEQAIEWSENQESGTFDRKMY